MTTDEDGSASPPLLSAIEARVLGVLIEKQATTPETYPLTLNAAQTACNQKTNREPLMELEAGDVGHALRELEGKDLVAASMSARASRYEHRIDQGLGITPRQRAALCVLLLRGPQTVNEIFVRCERLSDFPGADEVQVTLERLAQRTPALVVPIARAHGQREDRWAHLLCGPVDAAAFATTTSSAAIATPSPEAATRVEELERRVDELEQTLARVLARLEGG